MRPVFPERPRIIHGENCTRQIAKVLGELRASKVLLVTDPGIVEAGHVDYISELLENSGVSITIFDGVVENPTTVEVDKCANVARLARAEAIIGLGGGSTLDTAKGANIVITNGGEIKDYWGYGKVAKPMLPLIAIPTTAGTGSECQSYALISDAVTHQKMACGDNKALPFTVLLDPLLTLTQPHYVTACTGMDALGHAVETAVSLKMNPDSWKYSVASFRLCVDSLKIALLEAENLNSRHSMQLAAAYSGLAIERSMLGAAHAAANPLTAHFGITHGHAVATMLLSVIKYNSELSEAAPIYAKLMIDAGLTKKGTPIAVSIRTLLDIIGNIFLSTGLDMRLERLGVPRQAIPQLAREASGQWTAKFNPRPMAAEDFEALYFASF